MNGLSMPAGDGAAAVPLMPCTLVGSAGSTVAAKRLSRIASTV